MRRIMKVLFVLMFVFGMTACGSTKSNGPLTNDDYVKYVAQGLEARWQLTDAIDTSKPETKDDYESYINAELNVLSPLKDREFENTDMKKLADQYLEVLNESLKVVQNDWGTNKYDDNWNEVRDNRTVILNTINDLIKIPVKKQSTLDGLLNEGKLVVQIRKIIESTQFKKKKDDYGYVTYQAKVKNTTNQNFSYFSFNIKLYDKDGVVVETTSASTDNWTQGETHIFEFSTDEKVSKVVVASASY